ncbi:G-type lectin S-receptor-like serine/threonine-protein kinase LECRK4 [Dendrobium catenatum]|uniref:G-type lectin S-receptor-like serine/threonine-protein kinase LECRK4 n=1 Tax=Dendrobium catenatum TaxID=906689 RepID=UPI0010A05008|nr:G-type lectin S-receptor-like serine/threonine-protein kinase LECRK4 [Dendrobium catenatum]
MLLTNRLLLLFFFRAFCMKTIVDEVQAQASKSITYPALDPNKPVEPAITVGSSVTTDDNSSWISSSGNFAFGFYGESDGFFVGIRLVVSSTETVVVWTARPDLKRFSKDAFLNFTEEGLFVTPEKEAVAIPLFKFSLNATSANMLDNGNFVVFGSDISNISSTSEVVLATGVTAAAKPGVAYGSSCSSSSRCSSTVGGTYKSIRSCSAYTRCRASTSSDSIIWRSFDFPSDTILGDQYLPCGSNLTSSAGEKDHSIGKYILNFPCGGASLIFYGLKSSRDVWDTGASGGDYNYLNLGDDGRLYLTSSGGNEKDISDYKPNKDTSHVMIYRATLDSDNIFRLYAHNLPDKSTKMVNEIPNIRDSCQNKGICGVNSYCMLVYGNAECKCVPGFEIMSRDSQVTDCRRIKTVPSCVNLTSSAAAVFHMEELNNIAGMENLAYGELSLASREECSNACLNDCNCYAASFIDQKCLKLKLPLTSGRKDDNHPSVTFMKLAGAQSDPAEPQTRREVCIVAIILSAAATISIWIVVIAAFIGAYWFLFRKFREEWRKWELALTEEIAPRYFSYEELRKGSNEFKHVLGKGGYGTVFRADLPIGDSTVAVAVKKLHGAEMEGEREFQAEMRLIGRAYHANIVRLLGFCHDGPSRVIIYELMLRGSLANHIFESRGRRPSWERRAAILLAAARGIHYLHCECETKIIHRDIKPENILIAEDWTAKIADFGLAKLLNKNQMRAATRTLAAGTEGYVAPECEREVAGSEEAQVSEKADVYSYGIVVLETICSKRNMEVKELRKLSLCEMVRESYAANELWKLVDGDEVAAPELEKLVKIGLLCVQEDPNARPVMEDVVMMLEGDIDVPTPPSAPFSL